jgi:hypothetical protein
MAQGAGASGRPIREMPGIRVFYKVDWRAILSPILLVFWTVIALQTIQVVRPDLQTPAHIGTDSSNYYAAGQRLNDGHQLYELQAGDRAVGNGAWPTPWSYPLLSPPPIAVVWRVLALLPGDLSMYLWWLAGAAASFVFVALLMLRSRAGLYPYLVVLMPFMAITAWSGNANAFVIPICAALWVAVAKGRPGPAGFLLGVAFLLKLTPGLWIWWLLIRHDWRALAACLATIAVGLVVAVIGAGPASFVQYVDVAREAGSVALPYLSPIALAMWLGVPTALAHLLPYLIAAAAAALAWRWRSRPSWAFAACAVGVTLGTPDLRLEALGWLTVALVPFASYPMPWRLRRPSPLTGSGLGAGPTR